MADSESAAGAVESIVTELTDAMTTGRQELDTITHSTPTTRPPYVKRLVAVCSNARSEATSLIEEDSDASPEYTDSLELWDLAQPGHLLSAVQHHVPAPRGWWTLLPVVIAWAYLGAAELWYRNEIREDPERARAGFFSVWVDGPFILGPTMMAIIIVISVLAIMRQYAKFSRDLKEADRVDEAVENLERQIRPIVRRLRAAVLVRRRENATDNSAQLTAAASTLSGAAYYLETAVRGAGDFLSATAGLQKLGPTIAAEVERLVKAVDRTALVATSFETSAQQVTDAVAESREAAIEAAESSIRAEHHISSVDKAAAFASEAMQRAERSADAATRANEPLTTTTDSLRESSELLRTTAEAIGRSTSVLEAAAERLAWAISVSDGLNGRSRHTPPEPRP